MTSVLPTTLRRICLDEVSQNITSRLRDVLPTITNREKTPHNSTLRQLCSSDTFTRLREVLQVLPFYIAEDLLVLFQTTLKFHHRKYELMAAMLLMYREGMTSIQETDFNKHSTFSYWKQNRQMFNISEQTVLLEVMIERGEHLNSLTLHYCCLQDLLLFQSALEKMPNLQTLYIHHYCVMFPYYCQVLEEEEEIEALSIVSKTCTKLRLFSFLGYHRFHAGVLLFIDYPVNTVRSKFYDSLVEVEYFHDDGDFTSYCLLLRVCPLLQSVGNKNMNMRALNTYSSQEMSSGVNNPTTSLMCCSTWYLNETGLEVVRNVCPKLSTFSFSLRESSDISQLQHLNGVLTSLEVDFYQSNLLIKMLQGNQGCWSTLRKLNLQELCRYNTPHEILDISLISAACPRLQSLQCRATCITYKGKNHFHSLQHLYLMKSTSCRCIVSVPDIMSVLSNVPNLEELCLFLPENIVIEINNVAWNIRPLNHLKKIFFSTYKLKFSNFLSNCPNVSFVSEKPKLCNLYE